MSDLFKAIMEFHEHFELLPEGAKRVRRQRKSQIKGVPNDEMVVQYRGFSWFLENDLLQFRVKFLVEEFEEYEKASGVADRAEQLDALVDLAYVCLGTMYLMNLRPEHPIVGIDFTREQGILPLGPEEYREFCSRIRARISNLVAMQGVSLREQARALEDMMVDILCAAKAQGFNFKEAFDRVHVANMKKVRAQTDDESTRGSAKFDIVKPKGWKAPDLSDLVQGEMDV